ncbi:MAG: PQQ-dependent sugar dehydrogenase [Elusimicrobiota bacterium]|nr:MAG: PQQ-dependent sugar dehydrogenase [Elusimicrobiota bacterium]
MLSLLLAAALSAQAAPSARFEVETLAKRTDVIWGFDFLPDGRILFTERGAGSPPGTRRRETPSRSQAPPPSGLAARAACST